MSRLQNLTARHGFIGRQVKAEAAVGAAESLEAAPAIIAPAAARAGGQHGAGFFDRMFPDLPALVATENDLEALANAMKDAIPGNPAGDNPNVPAGFTYLGQFVDHDISLDLSPLSEIVGDPLMIKNFRTPSLDLDCVYGSGPGPHRFLFAREAGAENTFPDTARLLIGKTSPSPDAANVTIPALDNDLPRNAHGAALIGDHRNDENLVVAQTHLAFLKFHNRVVAQLAADANPPADLFGETSKQVRWHYQWMVLHDFIERITPAGMVADILANGRKFYRFRTKPFMPLEFSGAAYRLGHSMVREEYSHNRVFRPAAPRLAPATLGLLFGFSGLSGGIAGELAGAGGGPLPQRALPSNWVIDWRRFYDFKTPAGTPSFEFNASRTLDPFITPALHALPGFPAGREGNLAFRNLRRGVILGLPSGQDVAKAMRKKVTFNPLTQAEIETGPDGAIAKALGFHLKTPLWYYILKEAQIKGGGQRLGPVGGRMVAEFFVGTVQGDADSHLSQPGWTPTLPSKTPGSFLMTDLLQFVGDISPIDGITTVPTL